MRTIIALVLTINKLAVNAPRVNYRMPNFKRDGNTAFFNQGSLPNYISSIEPISFRERTVSLDRLHGSFTGDAITSLSEIREERLQRPQGPLGEILRCESERVVYQETFLAMWQITKTRKSSSARLQFSEKSPRTLRIGWRRPPA
jgi:hypothetical protein